MRHGLGMPAHNPEAIRRRAVDAARRRKGQPAPPTLDPVFVALNPGTLPARAKPEAELYQWVRRDEEYATLGANVVVELNSESRARQPTTPRLGDHPPRPPRPPATASTAASPGSSTRLAAPAGPAGHPPKSRNARW
jgi:hypothetical protein